MIKLEQAPFFDVFGEDAVIKFAEGDKPTQIIPDFDIVIEGDYAVGFDGIFDLWEVDYIAVKAGVVIAHEGKDFTVIQKKPPSGGVYQVLVQS